MKRETWRSDLWMAAQIYRALAHNQTCAIICRTDAEARRLRNLFKNVPVKIKKARAEFDGLGLGTVIIDEAQS